MKYKPTKLLWIDLEMTGLNPTKDIILEVAAMVSDFDFNILGTYHSRVKQARDETEKLFAANLFYSRDFTQNRDDFLKTLDSSKNSKQVENDLIDLIAKYFGDEPVIIAGNSIYNDRGFIQYWWPKFNEKLHYRMLDVSSWKIIMENKYALEYKKKDLHQAFSDIQESMGELKYYLNWFKKGEKSSSSEEE